VVTTRQIQKLDSAQAEVAGRSSGTDLTDPIEFEDGRLPRAVRGGAARVNIVDSLDRDSDTLNHRVRA